MNSFKNSAPLFRRTSSVVRPTVSIEDLPVGLWSMENRVIKFHGDWRPFTFGGGHEYLMEMYGVRQNKTNGRLEPDPLRSDIHPYPVIEKAAQMGATEFAISRALYITVNQIRTVIYFFPTDTDVRDFSNDRFRPSIYESPSLERLTGRIDNIHMVNIRFGIDEEKQSTIYFRGMESKTRTKSVPADSVFFDELEEAPWRHKAQAKQRISHSDLGWIMELSTPFLPKTGIDIEWLRSDQRYWNLKCLSCGEYTCLEDTFPECIIVDRSHPKGAVVCQKCRRPLNISNGHWVPRYPTAKHRGYHLSQLFSPVKTPAAILDEFENTNDIQEFWNSTIGNPYLDKDIMLVGQADLENCVDRDGRFGWDRSSECDVLGIDQGKVCHVVGKKIIGEDGSAGTLGPKTHNVFLETIQVDHFNRIAQLIELKRPRLVVIDAMPNSIPARELAKTYRNKVYLAWYIDGQREMFKLGQQKSTKRIPDPEDTYSVMLARTQSLEFSAKRIRDGLEVIPRPQDAAVANIARKAYNLCDLFFDHLKAQARKIDVIDEETGATKVKIINVGLDPHFAHANNYACMALTMMTSRPKTRIHLQGQTETADGKQKQNDDLFDVQKRQLQGYWMSFTIEHQREPKPEEIAEKFPDINPDDIPLMLEIIHEERTMFNPNPTAQELANPEWLAENTEAVDPF